MQITMTFQNYINAENKTATLLKRNTSLNCFNHILISLEDYMRTRYMHYVSHYWANCSNIFFKPPCIEKKFIKDVKAMLAYLLYTCNEMQIKCSALKQNEQKSRYFYYTRVLVQKKKYIFGNVAFYTFKCYKKRKKEQRNPLFH